jgi:type IV pilus assembly protein PilW
MRGFSLIELMVALVLGVLVTMVATVACQAAMQAYDTAVDRLLLERRGNHAIELITRLVHQSGWRVDAPASPDATNESADPALSARDDCGQPGISALPTCGRVGVARSDALLLRFGTAADALVEGNPASLAAPARTMVDCSGYAQGEHANQGSAGTASPYATTNLLYVVTGTDGSPQLLCRYPGRNNGGAEGKVSWTSGGMVHGVETLQFRFGIGNAIDNDTPGSGKHIARFVRASELNAEGAAAWRRVMAVQVALVLRSERTRPPHAGMPPTPLALLPSLGDDAAGSDVRFEIASASPALWALPRQVFSTTIRLRNPPPCSETLC